MQNNTPITADTVVSDHFDSRPDIYKPTASREMIEREITITESNIKLLQHMLDTNQLCGTEKRNRARNFTIPNLETKIERLRGTLQSEYGVKDGQ